MNLFVLFALVAGRPTPQPLAIVDPATIQESERTEAEYKKLVEAAVEETVDMDIEVSGWYELSLPPDAGNTVRRELLNQATVFPVHVTPSPIAEGHPSINGITVTVGRKPGKIIDDEIRG